MCSQGSRRRRPRASLETMPHLHFRAGPSRDLKPKAGRTVGPGSLTGSFERVSPGLALQRGSDQPATDGAASAICPCAAVVSTPTRPTEPGQHHTATRAAASIPPASATAGHGPCAGRKPRTLTATSGRPQVTAKCEDLTQEVFTFEWGLFSRLGLTFQCVSRRGHCRVRFASGRWRCACREAFAGVLPLSACGIGGCRGAGGGCCAQVRACHGARAARGRRRAR
jgi:hypothetical protein